MFLTSSYYSEKSVQRARPLNIVQSVQNFAHKLIFLCVTSRVHFQLLVFWATLMCIFQRPSFTTCMNLLNCPTLIHQKRCYCYQHNQKHHPKPLSHSSPL